MAKDPVFPFYSQDFLTGAMFMTNEQAGIYIRLLCAQHQHGGLIDKISFESLVGNHEIIRHKFIETEEGFYNERLMEEMIKRHKKSNNLSANAMQMHSKRIAKQKLFDANASQMHMPPEIENEKEIETKNKKFIAPTEEEVIKYFVDNGYRIDVAKRAFKYYSEMDWHDSRGNPIKRWKGKIVVVWFKEENRQIVRGRVNLNELNNERKNHTN